MQPLIVITGASSGIGEQTARKFSQNGYSTVLLARRKDKLEALQKELPSPSFVFPVDVRCKEGVKNIIEKIEKDLGPIALLVNNAGGRFWNRQSSRSLFRGLGPVR